MKNKILWDDLYPRTELDLEQSGCLQRIDDDMVKKFGENKKVFFLYTSLFDFENPTFNNTALKFSLARRKRKPKFNTPIL